MYGGTMQAPVVAAHVGFEIRVQIPLDDVRSWSPERVSSFFGGLAQSLAAAGAGGSIIVQLPTQLKTLAVIDAEGLTNALDAFVRKQQAQK